MLFGIEQFFDGFLFTTTRLSKSILKVRDSRFPRVLTDAPIKYFKVAVRCA